AFNQGVLGGLHFYGSDLTETTLERSNLAAVTTDDTILDWGPHAEGPIHALATDTSPPTPQVYFGGEGNILLLPSAPGAGQAVVGSAPGDGVAIIPNEWFTVATGAPGTRVVRALGVCPDALVIGGRFDKIEDLVTSNARTGAGAVPLFD